MPFLRHFQASGLALVWVVGSCAPGPELGQLKIQAAHDISCSEKDDIHSKSLGDDIYEVRGCGREAKYRWVCNGHGPMSPCRWVLQSKR